MKYIAYCTSKLRLLKEPTILRNNNDILFIRWNLNHKMNITNSREVLIAGIAVFFYQFQSIKCKQGFNMMD